MRLKTRKSEISLWVVQGLLAALFLFAGGMKLVMSLESMKGPVELPGLFLRFIGAAEVLGAFGLILPQALRIKQYLTPLAAAGLVIIMIGATTISVVAMGVAAAVMPFVAGVLAAIVAYSRWQPASRPAAARAAVLQPAN